MNQIVRGAKIPVGMPLDADLVHEARALTHSLSEKLEELLAQDVAEERSKSGEISMPSM